MSFHVTSKWFIILGFIILLSCNDADQEYKYDVPVYVEFRDQRFFPKEDSTDILELELLVAHQYPIGLDAAEDVYPPYHPYNFIIDSNDTLVKVNNQVVPPFYAVTLWSGQKLFSKTDNRPPYNCSDYVIFESNVDTFFIEPNRYYRNLFITFFDEDGRLLDLDAEFGNVCGINLNTRIPMLPSTGTYEWPLFKVKVLNGYQAIIIYKMRSNSFPFLYKDRKLSIGASVADRELNESNTAVSPAVFLKEIIVEN